MENTYIRMNPAKLFPIIIEIERKSTIKPFFLFLLSLFAFLLFKDLGLFYHIATSLTFIISAFYFLTKLKESNDELIVISSRKVVVNRGAFNKDKIVYPEIKDAFKSGYYIFIEVHNNTGGEIYYQIMIPDTKKINETMNELDRRLFNHKSVKINSKNENDSLSNSVN